MSWTNCFRSDLKPEGEHTADHEIVHFKWVPFSRNPDNSSAPYIWIVRIKSIAYTPIYDVIFQIQMRQVSGVHTRQAHSLPGVCRLWPVPRLSEIRTVSTRSFRRPRLHLDVCRQRLIAVYRIFLHCVAHAFIESYITLLGNLVILATKHQSLLKNKPKARGANRYM